MKKQSLLLILLLSFGVAHFSSLHAADPAREIGELIMRLDFELDNLIMAEQRLMRHPQNDENVSTASAEIKTLRTAKQVELQTLLNQINE